MCEVQITPGIKCKRKAIQSPHHMMGRMGEMLNKTEFWLACCMECHQYIEDHKCWARERGYILYK